MPVESTRRARSRGARAVILVAALGACHADAPARSAPPSPSRDPFHGVSSGAPHAVPPREAAEERDSVSLVLTADRGGGDDLIVSTGVPFAPGIVRDPGVLRLRDAHGAEHAAAVRVLARWPADGSIRSALVAFHATVSPRQGALFRVSWAPAPGAPLRDDALAPNPDGPVAVTLPSSWYAESRALGPSEPALRDTRFPGFEREIERALADMDPPYESYGVSCGGKAQNRTYYDGVHALYQRFVRAADAERYRRARAEAIEYRARELRFSPDRKVAIHVCDPPDFDFDKPMSWGSLRRLLGQGMLDDWLLTGDPAARDAVVAMGEAVRRDLHALVSGKNPALFRTERNMAFALLALDAYAAVDARPEILGAARSLVDRVVAWQERGRSGALEHDVHDADPSECERGPHGASPFMTALLVDALMDYDALAADPRLPNVVTRIAHWLATDAVTSDHRAFRYLWGCETDAYDDSETVRLNLLIVPVFGAAYALSKDPRWLDVGDHFADEGIDAMDVRHPKQWNQAMRGFPRYLGYRARR